MEQVHSGDQKKISFGFSRISKKQPPQESLKPKRFEKIDFIECVEENSIKVVGKSNPYVEELVIPLKDDNSLLKSMIDTVKKRKETEGVTDKNCSEETKKEALSLDELAVKELLADANNKPDLQPSKVFEVPLPSKTESEALESSLDDYEDVPIQEFGLAMLRGMGWNPNKGMGKSEKLVTVKLPTLRPKGMGLGADKAFRTKTVSNNTTVNADDVQIKKGATVKILAGPQKNLYGIIEGLDDSTGRAVVRLTISNATVSFSEFMVALVSKEEYQKNSKVINIQEYNNFTSAQKFSKESETKTVSKSPDRRKEKSNYGNGDGRSREERTTDRRVQGESSSRRYSPDQRSDKSRRRRHRDDRSSSEEPYDLKSRDRLKYNEKKLELRKSRSRSPKHRHRSHKSSKNKHRSP